MISPEILRRYPYFAAANDEGLRDLAMLCEEESIPSGTVMYQEGDPADKLFILVEGEVDIQYTLGTGELRTVDTIVPGELMMWSALVDPYKSTAVVTTRQDSKVIAMDATKLRGFCSSDREVANDVLLHVTKLLATRLGRGPYPAGHHRLDLGSTDNPVRTMAGLAIKISRARHVFCPTWALVVPLMDIGYSAPGTANTRIGQRRSDKKMIDRRMLIRTGTFFCPTSFCHIPTRSHNLPSSRSFIG